MLDSKGGNGGKVDNYNPLIRDNSEDTLHHTHCLLLLLEELHAFKDTHNSMGVYALLQCANHALVHIAVEADRSLRLNVINS
jgi:hypothetical protein